MGNIIKSISSSMIVGGVSFLGMSAAGISKPQAIAISTICSLATSLLAYNKIFTTKPETNSNNPLPKLTNQADAEENGNIPAEEDLHESLEETKTTDQTLSSPLQEEESFEGGFLDIRDDMTLEDGINLNDFDTIIKRAVVVEMAPPLPKADLINPPDSFSKGCILERDAKRREWIGSRNTQTPEPFSKRISPNSDVKRGDWIGLRNAQGPVESRESAELVKDTGIVRRSLAKPSLQIDDGQTIIFSDAVQKTRFIEFFTYLSESKDLTEFKEALLNPEIRADFLARGSISSNMIENRQRLISLMGKQKEKKALAQSQSEILSSEKVRTFNIPVDLLPIWADLPDNEEVRDGIVKMDKESLSNFIEFWKQISLPEAPKEIKKELKEDPNLAIEFIKGTIHSNPVQNRSVLIQMSSRLQKTFSKNSED